MKSFRLFSLLSFLLFISACAPVSIPTVVPAKSGAVLYQEEFEKNTTGWARISNDNGIMDYDGGGYRMLVRQPKLNIWSTPNKNFGNVRIEVDAIRLNGPEEDRMGLMCRYQHGNYYFFIISNDGYFAIGKFIGGNTILLGQEQMQASDVIQKDTKNHLRADCIGTSLTFFVNFKQVAAVVDPDLPTGDVGLLAGTFSTPGADVMFDHFMVIQP